MYPAGSTIKEQSVHNLHIYIQILPYLWNSGIMIQWQWPGVFFFFIIKTQMLSFYNACLQCWGLPLWEKLSIHQ